MMSGGLPPIPEPPAPKAAAPMRFKAEMSMDKVSLTLLLAKGGPNEEGPNVVCRLDFIPT